MSYRANTCDHMIYDGACECHDRRVEGEDFWAELATATVTAATTARAATTATTATTATVTTTTAISTDAISEQLQEHLADMAAEDAAEHARLIEYLAESQDFYDEDRIDYYDEDNDHYYSGHYTPAYETYYNEPEFERHSYNYDSDF